MNSIYKRISYLFNLYYTRRATPEELHELFKLLKEHAMDDTQLTGLMKEEWDGLNAPARLFDKAKSEAILDTILRLPKNSK